MAKIGPGIVPRTHGHKALRIGIVAPPGGALKRLALSDLNLDLSREDDPGPPIDIFCST